MERATLLALVATTAALAACTGKEDDSGGGDTSAPAAWTLVAEDQPAAFLDIRGTSASDVWAVGADAGSGPAMIHYDGTAWTTIPLASSGDLWWIGDAGGGDLWIVGAGGRVLRYSPTSGLLDETVLDAATTLFGVWSAGANEAWAVGGNIDAASDAAQVWHYDGSAWSAATIPAEAAAGIAIYKVWGRSGTDVYAVGTGGIVLHWDGAAWSTVASGTESNLFTVSGSATDQWAVGGDFTGEILHGTTGGWSNEAPTMAPQLYGVDATGQAPIAVGGQGVVYTRASGSWVEDERGRVTTQDLHAVWVDPDGGVWTVGGHTASFPLDHGIVAYGGSASLPPL